MSEAMPALFDFAPFVEQSDSHVQTLKEFAAGNAFRSATVDELVLDGDFYRRPLRPEDLSFLKFTRPVQAASVARLPSLASQRSLNCLYELMSAVPPREAGWPHRHAFDEFANERNRQHAARLMPFLEAYAFEYLGDVLPAGERSSSYPERLGRLYADEYRFWMRLFGQLKDRGYLQEGLRFILIQRWCLAPSLRNVLVETAEHGRRDGWPTGVEPNLDAGLLGDSIMSRIAATLNVERSQHSYWQFYLPTSLSKCNLLYALARRIGRPFALYGAMYAAQAERLALEAAIAQCCPDFVAGVQAPAETAEVAVTRLLHNFEAALQCVQSRHPAAAVREVGQGLAAAGRLADRARWDLGEQLKWLSAIDHYCELARVISRRIEAEHPDIDRETFVEPRCMCSTTHVHNDHRLVTIQEGVMHFWGNLGMCLEMHPGDCVLIPEGRLHGSTVLSAECTYHQPIIPDEWIQKLVDQAPEQPHDLCTI